jgi:tRNA(Ile)-lysidine synthase
MLQADGDRMPVTRWPGAVVRRYRGRLYASPSDAPANWCPGRWAPGEQFALGSDGRLELVAATGVGLSRGRLAGGLEVVPRPEGGAFKPAGHPHHRELRKWLQEHGVLPWRRAGLPFIVVGGEVVAIGDLAYGGTLAAGPGEPSWRVVWHGRPTLTEAEALAGRAAA